MQDKNGNGIPDDLDEKLANLPEDPVFLPEEEESEKRTPERTAELQKMLEASDRDELKIEDLNGADLADFIEFLRERKETRALLESQTGRRQRFSGFRETIETTFYDTAIQRDRPHRLALYPSGWCNSDVGRVVERSGRIKLFAHSGHIGDEAKSNMAFAGVLHGDQTMVMQRLKAVVRGSRLKGEDYAAFLGLAFIVKCGEKDLGTFAATAQPLIIDGVTVGVEFVYKLTTFIPVPARMGWHIEVVIPKAAWDLLDFVEGLRVDLTARVTRDVY